jgi:hypothetical protein
LPERVTITFYSYSEDTFYRGAFDLPYERIAKLFADGYRSYHPGTPSQITFNAINIGVTIGGAVAVWVEGIGRRQEVFFGQAEAFDGNWQHLTQMPYVKKTEIIEDSLKQAAERDLLIERYMSAPPLGLWAKYRTPYVWRVTVEGLPAPRQWVRYDFFNGEQFDLPWPMKPAQWDEPRPLPRHIFFDVQQPERDYLTRLEYDFDDTEIYDAFQRLGADGTSVELVFRRAVVGGAYRDLAVLRRGDQEMPLERTKIQLSRVRY